MKLIAVALVAAFLSFAAEGQDVKAYDVVIDEVMADPSPAVQLPNAEYVELKNTTGHSIQLAGWKISSTSTKSKAFPAYELPAGGFLIVTALKNKDSFARYGNVLG